jgi:hypothetical protein
VTHDPALCIALSVAGVRSKRERPAPASARRELPSSVRLTSRSRSRSRASLQASAPWSWISASASACASRRASWRRRSHRNIIGPRNLGRSPQHLALAVLASRHSRRPRGGRRCAQLRLRPAVRPTASSPGGCPASARKRESRSDHRAAPGLAFREVRTPGHDSSGGGTKQEPIRSPKLLRLRQRPEST